MKKRNTIFSKEILFLTLVITVISLLLVVKGSEIGLDLLLGTWLILAKGGSRR